MFSITGLDISGVILFVRTDLVDLKFMISSSISGFAAELVWLYVLLPKTRSFFFFLGR